MRKFFLITIAFFSLVFLITSIPAQAEMISAVSYKDSTRYLCRYGPIKIHSGQNLNLLALTTTCPRPQKISGPGPAAPTGDGFITSFRPNLVELKKNGIKKIPRVDDLHLHHVVWLRGLQPSFAAGEEKTIYSFPRGYGLQTNISNRWGINYMIHNLWPQDNRRVEIEWIIDWLPQEKAPDTKDVKIQWMDVAGDNLYPVFDAEKRFDKDRDGVFVFPDGASSPDHPEHDKISQKASWLIDRPLTLVFGAGHLHPGGKFVELLLDRGPARKTIFRSDARYWGPAGAASWDVSMEATKRSWRVALRPGDVLRIRAAYNVKKASWYEAMGILPLAFSEGHSPEAKDPFDSTLTADGLLTHGRLKENWDDRASKSLKLKSPLKLPPRKTNKSEIKIKSYLFSPGGYSATPNFPAILQRPALLSSSPFFINEDAPESAEQEDQIWHTVTSCKAPCNLSSGISYPLADGRFDSGQLGFGIDDISNVFTGVGYWNESVTRGTSSWRAPNLDKGTYTFFCRIHPFMRGSFKIK